MKIKLHQQPPVCFHGENGEVNQKYLCVGKLHFPSRDWGYSAEPLCHTDRLDSTAVLVLNPFFHSTFQESLGLTQNNA